MLTITDFHLGLSATLLQRDKLSEVALSSFPASSRQPLLPTRLALSIYRILIVLWIVISIPAYVLGPPVTGGKANFESGMGATLLCLST